MNSAPIELNWFDNVTAACYQKPPEMSEDSSGWCEYRYYNPTLSYQSMKVITRCIGNHSTLNLQRLFELWYLPRSWSIDLIHGGLSVRMGVQHMGAGAYSYPRESWIGGRMFQKCVITSPEWKANYQFLPNLTVGSIGQSTQGVLLFSILWNATF